MKMRSGYGIRLYEQCLRWGFREEWEVTVGEFREMMGLQDQYSTIDNLKRRVVEPAMRDVNEFTEFRVRFGQRKVGRTITHFQFAIETVEPAQTRKVKGSKKGNPDSRQLRIRELVLEVEGLDRLIGNGDDPSENERELMKQREELQRELDGLRQAGTGSA